jgi:hypothetical protein
MSMISQAGEISYSAGMRRRTRRFSLRFRMLASLSILLVFFGVLEATARTFAPIVPAWQAPDKGGVMMTGHPTRLWGMAPGERRNVDTTAYINELGLRGEIPITPRPKGRERVLILGDSSFFGHGVSDDSTIVVRVVNNLKEKGIDIDGINGAIPGYSTEQSVLLMEEVGWDLEPSLLLIGNLWSDNNADGFRDADLLKTMWLYHNNPLSQSAFFQLAVGWLDRARGGTGGRVITWTKDSTWPEARQRRVPLQDYARNLDKLVRAAKKHGAGVMFLAPANQGTVDEKYKNGAGWDPYFDAQKAVAAWHEVPVLPLKDALKADPTPTAAEFLDQMHPSVAGTISIAKAIADALLSLQWPQNRLFGKSDPFDASGLKDTMAFMSGGQDVRLSPQAQLFPNAIPPTTTTQVASQDGSWDINGVVYNAAAPTTITFRGPEGQIIATITQNIPGPFLQQIPPSINAVDIEAEDAKHRVERGQVTKAQKSINLEFH